MDPKEHWEQVYRTRAVGDVSWHQVRPALSFKLIESSGIAKDQAVIDVGGGASVLVDFLLDAGFTRLAVLDIAATALRHAKERLGAKAGSVDWFEADVTAFDPPQRFNLWHDRAVFHFLTHRAGRQKYVQTLKRTLTPDGQVIIGTLAIDGPLKCSGLDVARYDVRASARSLAMNFVSSSNSTKPTLLPGTRNRSSVSSALLAMLERRHETNLP